MINHLRNKALLFFAIALSLTAIMQPIASAQGSTTNSGSDSVTLATRPGVTCTSYWKWYVYYPVLPTPTAPYSQVEWTSNSCGFYIKDRSQCLTTLFQYYWTYSGYVKSTYLWDGAKCSNNLDAINQAQQSFRAPGGNWSTWKTYWHS